MDPSTLLGRLPAALGVNLLLAAAAWRAGSVRPSGFLAGVFLGTLIYVALDWRGFLVLVAFFVIGSALTRLGYARKAALGAAEAEGGARGASNAFAKTGIPAALAALGGWTGDPVWALAFTGAFAAGAMDTTGSEIGPLYGRRTISLASGRAVPPGTEGAVSLEGTVAGLAAALVIGSVAAGGGLLSFPEIPFVLAGAALGNLVEGLLGARRLLPHAWLNVVNLLVGAALACLLGSLAG